MSNERAKEAILRQKGADLVKRTFTDDITTIKPLERYAFNRNRAKPPYSMATPSGAINRNMVPVNDYLGAYIDRRHTIAGVDIFFREGDRIAVVTSSSEDIQGLSLIHPGCFFEQVAPANVNGVEFNGKNNYDRIIVEGLSEQIDLDSTEKLMDMLKEGGIMRANMAEGKQVRGQIKRSDILAESGNIVLKPQFNDRKLDIIIAIKPWKK